MKERQMQTVELEQREAKQRAASLAGDTARAREEVTRLVRLCDDFKDRLARVTQERDTLRADYDARGDVIKKLRKRLHKLKKKLKR